MLLHGRTDLASEARDMLSSGVGEVEGILAREELIHGHRVVCVDILDRRGADTLGKPQGRYFTLTLGSHFERGDSSFSDAAQAVAELIRRCGGEGVSSCLIAALGNPDITPDALGNLAASSILVTRHLKASSPAEFAGFIDTALCRTGVLGTTGVESAVQIRSLCDELKPALVIAVDALAGSELAGLCRSIQVCSSGIAPGSGIGNARKAIDRATLGIPVISVGVPTLVDSSTLIYDMLNLAGADDIPDCVKNALDNGRSFFVTLKDADSASRENAKLIARAINLAFSVDLSE